MDGLFSVQSLSLSNIFPGKVFKVRGGVLDGKKLSFIELCWYQCDSYYVDRKGKKHTHTLESIECQILIKVVQNKTHDCDLVATVII